MGGGQTPGDTIGNERATSILFAREGARAVVVDQRLESAEEQEISSGDVQGHGDLSEVGMSHDLL